MDKEFVDSELNIILGRKFSVKKSNVFNKEGFPDSSKKINFSLLSESISDDSASVLVETRRLSSEEKEKSIYLLFQFYYPTKARPLIFNIGEKVTFECIYLNSLNLNADMQRYTDLAMKYGPLYAYDKAIKKDLNKMEKGLMQGGKKLIEKIQEK